VFVVVNMISSKYILTTKCCRIVLQHFMYSFPWSSVFITGVSSSVGAVHHIYALRFYMGQTILHILILTTLSFKIDS